MQEVGASAAKTERVQRGRSVCSKASIKKIVFSTEIFVIVRGEAMSFRVE